MSIEKYGTSLIRKIKLMFKRKTGYLLYGFSISKKLEKSQEWQDLLF